MRSSFAPQWRFAKQVYETLKDGPNEPAARAYLEATARLVLLSVATNHGSPEQR